MFRLWNNSFQKRRNEVSERGVHAERRKLKFSNTPYEGPHRSIFRGANVKSIIFPIFYINQRRTYTHQSIPKMKTKEDLCFANLVGNSSRNALKITLKHRYRLLADKYRHTGYRCTPYYLSYLGKIMKIYNNNYLYSYRNLKSDHQKYLFEKYTRHWMHSNGEVQKSMQNLKKSHTKNRTAKKWNRDSNIRKSLKLPKYYLKVVYRIIFCTFW